MRKFINRIVGLTYDISFEAVIRLKNEQKLIIDEVILKRREKHFPYLPLIGIEIVDEIGSFGGIAEKVKLNLDTDLKNEHQFVVILKSKNVDNDSKWTSTVAAYFNDGWQFSTLDSFTAYEKKWGKIKV